MSNLPRGTEIMRFFACLLLSFLMMSPTWAEDGPHDAMLNKITLKFSAEQYVATKTALVTVGVNASVNASAYQKVQDDVLKKLQGISSQGEWHITSFDRSLDQSGLEKIQMSAQARLPAASLSDLTASAKSISKPGETFSLDNVEFTPSEQELRDANTVLRSNVYQQAKEEIDRANKIYPDQHYYIHDVDFVGNIIRMPIEGFGGVRAMAMAVPAANNGANNNGLAVGDKLTISATVVLASLPADRALIKSIT
jgi:hypothetical protein